MPCNCSVIALQVLVLPLMSRVDERRLAALLHTGRSRVRLAPSAALPELCGYTGAPSASCGLLLHCLLPAPPAMPHPHARPTWRPHSPAACCPPLRAVGNVPPFGHRRALPVIVDSSVTAFASCYAGGGSDAAEILLSVPELLRATGATVADISLPGRAGGTSSGLPGSLPSSNCDLPPAQAGKAAAATRLEGAAAVAAAALPLPWQPGQTEVTIEGVVAHR